MTEAYIYVDYRDGAGRARRVVLPTLSFSSGVYNRGSDNSQSISATSLEVQQTKDLATTFTSKPTRPSSWSTQQAHDFVARHLPNEPLAKALLDADIDGLALVCLTSEAILKDFGGAAIKYGPRLRFFKKLEQLQVLEANWEHFFPQSEADDARKTPERNDINIMLVLSAGTMRLQYLLLTEALVDAAVVYFRVPSDGNRGGWGRREGGEKTPEGLGLKQPFFAVVLKNAHVTSYQESGSSENPTVSVQFSAAPSTASTAAKSAYEWHHRGVLDFENLGSDLMACLLPEPIARDIKEVKGEDPTKLISVQSIVQSNAGKFELIQFGQGMVWTREIHQLFPFEFRATARTLVLVLRTARTSPTGVKVANDIINVILRHLARKYSLNSPLDQWQYPRTLVEDNAPNDNHGDD